MPKIVQIYQKLGNKYLPLINREDQYLQGLNLSMNILSRSGRYIWVDYDTDCICIEFNYWGADKILQVPFAKYRTEELFAFGTSGLDIPELESFIFSTPSYIVGDSPINNKSEIPVINDNDLKSKFAVFKTDKTGREICDVLMSYTEYEDENSIVGVPAIQWCRNLTTEHITEPGHFDLPNFYEACVIFSESDSIDELDPYSKIYPDRKLGFNNVNGRFNGNSIWVPIEDESNNNIYTISSFGCITSMMRSELNGIIPCRVI